MKKICTWIFIATLVILSFPVWIFTTLYKYGMVFHDNIMNYVIKQPEKDDKGYKE